MKLIRTTVARAICQHLAAQMIDNDGSLETLFGCAFAIFGHGNVTCLGQQLKEIEATIPTWRGQNEQSMANAAVAFAKTKLRRQIGIATSSIGPGATNMVTAAAVAHTNRLPLLLLSGDAYVSRLPDPVLQQVEQFHNPTLTVNDTFKPVVRYWDRITSPEQVLQSLPQAISIMLDPGECGPAFIGLPQDVQGYVYEYPQEFFEQRIHRIRRPEPEQVALDAAARMLRGASKPLIVSGGGVHYSLASDALREFAERHQIPVVETIAGRAALLHDHPLNCGPIGVTGSESANALAAEADCVLAVGTRLQDFTTNSWAGFHNPQMKLITINAARHDAVKHAACPVIADVRAALPKLAERLTGWGAQEAWRSNAREATAAWHAKLEDRINPEVRSGLPSYAQVIGVINRLATASDRVVAAAGGLPAEVAMNWKAKSLASIDIEFGYSCMGYEIAGGWGARLAKPDGDVIVFVGDGSYLMHNSDIYSSVLSGCKLILIVCDNGGFAVIEKLQRNTGNESFNNQFVACRHQRGPGTLPRVDFVQHAASLGAQVERVKSMSELANAFARAKAAAKTYAIVIEVDEHKWSSVDNAWWQIGLPQVTDREDVKRAAASIGEGQRFQRRGV
jgi:3D-(3,5/4)-trihydroxycyclohexane-1,2-dione acylhydrolase (decyclizing)